MWLVAVAVAGSPEYEQCSNSAAITWDLVRCDEEETARIEERIASHTSHKAWLAFRDERCSPPSDEDADGGMLRHLAQARESCRLAETEKRADQLEGRSAPAEPEYQRCQKAPSLLDCVTQANQREDKRLNTVYGQLMASALPQPQKDWLRAAERLWIPYRDAACAEEAKAQGGGAMASVRCALRLTTEQADWLQVQLPKAP